MSNGWVKGQGLFKNLKALNQKQNERARILQEEKEAKRLQSGYDRVSGGDVAYSHHFLVHLLAQSMVTL